jgi:hypothetical protein
MHQELELVMIARSLVRGTKSEGGERPRDAKTMP